MADQPTEWNIQDGDCCVSDFDSTVLDEYNSDFITVVDQFCQSGSSRGEEPTHIDTMREKSLFDYEDTGEPGQLRSYPRGKIIRDILIDFVESMFLDVGSMPVETPTMYEIDGAIREHAESFSERQYRFKSNGQDLMLRFASDFGHFSIFQDAYFSENKLPLSIHEICRYAFRKEQRGELVGLYRLSSFTMPDMHTVVRDEERARGQFIKYLELVEEVEEATQLNYQPILRITDEFYDENIGWVEALSEELNRPILVQKLDEQHSYWAAKIDFAFVDGHDHVTEGPTIQLDLETTERFDISYTDGANDHHPMLLHFSPTGSIERLCAMLLESAALDRNPHLPEWLAPTQVRLIPVSEQHLKKCSEIAERLESERLRVEVDDRDETVSKQVKDAEEDWVAFYSVIGDDELESGNIRVHIRSQNKEIEISDEEYHSEISNMVAGSPRRRHPLPRYMSKHVTF